MPVLAHGVQFMWLVRYGCGVSLYALECDSGFRMQNHTWGEGGGDFRRNIYL